MLATHEADEGDVPYPVSLEHLAIRYNVLCQIMDMGEAQQQGRFTVISCESHQSDLIEYFLRTMDVHIHHIGPNPSCKQISAVVEKLIELFRALSRPSESSIQGLWAELLIISELSNPRLLLRSWHATPEDRYDFCAGEQRVEVKSASGQVRAHHFSLEQLTPPPSTAVLVVSLFVERSAEGLTVLDLVDRIQAQIQNDLSLLTHLHRNVTLTLASDWQQAASFKFNHRLAKESVRLFDAGSIPSIILPVPMEVTEVKFKANLSRTIPSDVSSLASQGGMFAIISQLVGAPVSV